MNTPMPTASSTVSLFDASQLMLGDILLERGTDAGARFVAAATFGRFSHALMWVGDDFLEAMPGGARVLSFARVPVTQPLNWALRRPKPEFREVAAEATVHARRMVFERYDFTGAILTQVGGRPTAAPGARFCSQLIAEAYRQAGLDLIPGKRPEQMTPNMLRSLRSHDAVTLPLVDAANLLDAPYPPELLNRSDAFQASPMHQEGEMVRRFFDAVSDLVNVAPWPIETPTTHGAVIDYLALLPLQFSGPIADRLLVEMERDGYFTLLVRPMAELLPQVDSGYADRVPGWREVRSRHLQNAEMCLQRGHAMPHLLWDRLRAMYVINAGAFSALIEKATGST